MACVQENERRGLRACQVDASLLLLCCMLAGKLLRKLRRQLQTDGGRSPLLRSGRPTGKDSTASPSGQQTRARQSASVGGHQQNIFDFDGFIRAHYGEQLQREKELRQRKEMIRQKQNKQFEDVKLGRMKEVAVGMLLVMAVSIVLSLSSKD